MSGSASAKGLGTPGGGPANGRPARAPVISTNHSLRAGACQVSRASRPPGAVARARFAKAAGASPKNDAPARLTTASNPAVGERVHLGVRADERGVAEAGGAGARDVDHRGGEVDAEYRPRGGAPGGRPGERAGAAADVEDARAGSDPRGVEQRAVVARGHLLEQVGVNGPEPALGAVPRLFLRGVRGRHQMIGVRRVDAAVHGSLGF